MILVQERQLRSPRVDCCPPGRARVSSAGLSGPLTFIVCVRSNVRESTSPDVLVRADARETRLPDDIVRYPVVGPRPNNENGRLPNRETRDPQRDTQHPKRETRDPQRERQYPVVKTRANLVTVHQTQTTAGRITIN